MASEDNEKPKRPEQSKPGRSEEGGTPVGLRDLLRSATTQATGLLALVGGAAGIAALLVATGVEKGIVLTLVISGAIVVVMALVLLFRAFSARRVPLSVAVMAAAGTCILVAGAAIGYYSHSTGTDSAPSRESSLTTSISPNSAASTASGPCAKPLTITSPKNGTKIVGHDGVKIDITACGLTTGETGWLLDNEDGYGLDNGGPVITQDGKITFTDADVGGSGDVNQPVILTLVLADSACSQALSAFNDSTQPTSLPPGCKIASTVTVLETW